MVSPLPYIFSRLVVRRRASRGVRRSAVPFCAAPGVKRRRGEPAAAVRGVARRLTARRVSAARTGGGRNSRPEPRQAPRHVAGVTRRVWPVRQRPGASSAGAQTAQKPMSAKANTRTQKARRAQTRRSAAFHALEDVTPRLLVCFWTWLATSIYEASSLGICCWSQRLKRGGRKRTHVFLPTAPRLIAALRPRTQRRGSQPTLNTECCTHYYLAARRRAPHT